MSDMFATWTGRSCFSCRLQPHTCLRLHQWLYCDSGSTRSACESSICMPWLLGHSKQDVDASKCQFLSDSTAHYKHQLHPGPAVIYARSAFSCTTCNYLLDRLSSSASRRRPARTNYRNRCFCCLARVNLYSSRLPIRRQRFLNHLSSHVDSFVVRIRSAGLLGRPGGPESSCWS
jgi:hypothetical protein